MKTDARVRYTKMRIRESFLQCLREKPLNKVTVKEICVRAEINRATFYTHYADPFDLMEQIETEALEGLKVLIANRSSEGGILPAVLTGMAGPGTDYAVLISPNGDPSFAARCAELFRQEFIHTVAGQLSNATEAERDRAYHFLMGGCGNLIAAWMEEGMTASPEELAEELGRLSQAFLQAYVRLGK